MYSNPISTASITDYCQLSDLVDAQELEMHIFTSPANGLSRMALEEIRSVLHWLEEGGVHVTLREHSVDDGSAMTERMGIVAVPTTVISNCYIVGVPTQDAVMRAIRHSLHGS